MRAIALDLSRLFIGPLRPTPRGIDRVELILARHFLDSSDWTAFGLLPTPWGVRIFSQERAIRGLAKAEEIWNENAPTTGDPNYQWLKARLLGKDAGQKPFGGKLSAAQMAVRMGRMLAATGIVPGRSVKRHLPPNSVYLNVGQTSLAIPALLRWLEKRPDVRSAIMLHDVIPIDHPELVPRSSTHFHQKMLESAAQYAKGVIVTTDHARQTVSKRLAGLGRNDVLMLSAMLPLYQSFDKAQTSDPELEGTDYFLVIGAIEARKNLLLLLDVWKQLDSRLPGSLPHLVLAGSPNHRAKEIIERFSTEDSLASKIHFVSGLSSPSLNKLLAGARGLLMPSLTEGFGLPIIEAHALGCPVFASNIPAHREVTEKNDCLLPTDDPLAWIEAIADQLPNHNRKPATKYAVQATRETFVKNVEAFLEQLN